MKYTVSEKTSLFEFIMQKTGINSKTKVKDYIKQGRFTINDHKVDFTVTEVLPGEVLEFLSSTGTTQNNSQRCRFSILYEDKYLIAIEKPAGILSCAENAQPGLQTAFGVVNEYLDSVSKGKIKPYIVHRLDKEVSGILLFAKDKNTQNILRDNWYENQKYYYALTEGCPTNNSGTIQSWQKEGAKQKVVSYPNEIPGSKLAVTHYTVVKQINENALLEIRIETGRKNQIRVHCADLGCPIVGDCKYGADATYHRRIRLHAFKLIINHPVIQNEIVISSDLPPGFIRLLPQNENYK